MPELEDDEEWEVEEEIKGEQKFDGDPHFLVKWKGWPSEYNQWFRKQIWVTRKKRSRGSGARRRKERRRTMLLIHIIDAVRGRPAQRRR